MISDLLDFLYKIFYKKVSKVIIIALVCFIFLILIFRGIIIRSILDNKIKSFNKEYGALLKYDKLSVKRLTCISIDGIDLQQAENSNLLHADKVEISLEFWKLFAGRLSFDSFIIKNLILNIDRSDVKDNFSFLYKKRNPAKNSEKDIEQNYAKSAENIFRAIFDKLPSNMHISKLLVNANIKGHHIKVFSNELWFSDDLEKNFVFVSEDSTLKSWIVESAIEKSTQKIFLKIYTPLNKTENIPFIGYKWGLIVNADTIRMEFSKKSSYSNMFCTYGSVSLSGLKVFHKRISQDTVKSNNIDFDLTINFGKDFIELDSISKVSTGSFYFNPYICYHPLPSKQITLSINKKDFIAQNLFSSLPDGLFTNFRGIKTSGNLNFHLFFNIDMSLPDSLKFESDLTSSNFKIIKYGETDFRIINGTFEYTAFDKGIAVKSFLVGPENPNFKTISEVPLYLQNAILMSEDGWFYYHKGFLPAAFREAMVTNIKEKRFARGGSTITMQLVKNVFLNKNKNISRKIEEAGIVWIIENLRLCSKERLFEVYLNIIEWGPGVYGANEAANFYFAKDVSKLSISECIFLAGIIPCPKGFKYAFNDDGSLKDYMVFHFQKVSEKLLEHNMISESEFNSVKPEINLKGPAKEMLKKKENFMQVPDSNDYKNEIIFD